MDVMLHLHQEHSTEVHSLLENTTTRLENIETRLTLNTSLTLMRMKLVLYSQESPNALKRQFKFGTIKAKRGEIVRDMGSNIKTKLWSLKKYLVLEAVQMYLWPRLCKLDHRTFNLQCLSFEAALFDSSLASSKLCIYTFTESEYPLASLEQHIEQLKRQKTNNKCVAPALATKPPQHKQQQQQQQQK
ncbi:hypothetical protein JHK85_043873 [Glycine max]|nr:hypothetical protein JHK85_043873 [Glycine max]